MVSGGYERNMVRGGETGGVWLNSRRGQVRGAFPEDGCWWTKDGVDVQMREETALGRWQESQGPKAPPGPEVAWGRGRGPGAEQVVEGGCVWRGGD